MHHGYDNDNFVRSEISEKWINEIKKYNFISAVLHEHQEATLIFLKEQQLDVSKLM